MTPVLSDFSSRATRVGTNKWRVNIQDGQFGSYPPAGTNALLFEGGPACFSDQIFQSGFENSEIGDCN